MVNHPPPSLPLAMSVCTCAGSEGSTARLTGQILCGSVSSVTFTHAHLHQPLGGWWLRDTAVWSNWTSEAARQTHRTLLLGASTERRGENGELVVRLAFMSGWGFCFLVFAFFSSGSQSFPASWFSPSLSRKARLPIIRFCYWRGSHTSGAHKV